MKCRCLEKLTEHTDGEGPFQQSIRVSEPATRFWVATAPKRTKRNYWSTTEKVTVVMNFCPVCGEPLVMEA